MYDESFEELEQLEIIILAGIDSCIKGLNDPNMLVGSFVDIIRTFPIAGTIQTTVQ